VCQTHGQVTAGRIAVTWLTLRLAAAGTAPSGFNDRLRDQCLNEHPFSSLAAVRPELPPSGCSIGYDSLDRGTGRRTPAKKHKSEEILGKLREVEVMLGKGGTTAEACRRIGVQRADLLWLAQGIRRA